LAGHPIATSCRLLAKTSGELIRPLGGGRLLPQLHHDYVLLPHTTIRLLLAAGELIRPVVADLRERLTYNGLVGAGTYIFR